MVREGTAAGVRANVVCDFVVKCQVGRLLLSLAWAAYVGAAACRGAFCGIGVAAKLSQLQGEHSGVDGMGSCLPPATCRVGRGTRYHPGFCV